MAFYSSTVNKVKEIKIDTEKWLAGLTILKIFSNNAICRVLQTQLVCTCSKSTKETPEQNVTPAQS